MQITRTLLLIDDEPDVLELLVNAAAPLGCIILTASDGVGALEIVANNDVDVIVSDISMPKLDGMGLLRELRGRGFRRPFIFATGLARHDSTVEALRMGAFDFLEKPFELAQVSATLRQALANARTVSPDLALDGLVGRDALAAFAEDGAAQLAFASSALSGLTQEERYLEDTSFLLRISVALEAASRGLGHATIEKVATAAVELFTELRIDGRMASEAQLTRAGALIGWLRDAIDGVGSACRLETLAERLLAPDEVKRKRAS